MRWDDHGARQFPGCESWELDVKTGRYHASSGAVRHAKSRSRAARRALQAGGVRDGDVIRWSGQPMRKQGKHRGVQADNTSPKYRYGSSYVSRRPF